MAKKTSKNRSLLHSLWRGTTCFCPCVMPLFLSLYATRFCLSVCFHVLGHGTIRPSGYVLVRLVSPLEADLVTNSKHGSQPLHPHPTTTTTTTKTPPRKLEALGGPCRDADCSRDSCREAGWKERRVGSINMAGSPQWCGKHSGLDFRNKVPCSLPPSRAHLSKISVAKSVCSTSRPRKITCSTFQFRKCWGRGRVVVCLGLLSCL